MENRRARLIPLLPIAAALATLGGLAAAHPGLRFVDFLSFAGRARRLTEGQDWVNGLYPVGYPLALLALKGLLGDVLVAGKVLSVAAGGLAAWAVGRLTRPGLGVAVLAVPAVLTWGSTEGTDLLAAALALAALATTERPHLSGALVGAACLTRYTGVAALPPVLLLTRGRALPAFALATAPHWLTALWLHLPMMPDQSGNMAIGAGPGGPSSWVERLPAGAARAARDAFGAPWAGLGLLGLGVGAFRRQRAAMGLLGLAVLHVLGVGLAFSNERLVLPATLAAVTGLAWLLPEGRRPWLALLALLALPQLPRAATVSEDERALAEIAAVEAPGPVLSTNPMYHQRVHGWLDSGVFARSLGVDPRRLTPDTLREVASQRGFQSVAIEAGRVSATWPGLRPLSRGEAPPGFTLLGEAGPWRVFLLDHDQMDHGSSPRPGL